MGKLQGKTAIITGATGGIGEATAKLFLAEGANVMLVGRSTEKLQATLGRLGASKSVALAIADAVDEKATAEAVAATTQAFGGVDILLANAGDEGAVKPVDVLSFAEFEHVLRTNVLGVWLAMKYCVEPMKKRGKGSMIALSSVAGMVGFTSASAYAASKHAVFGLVKCTALELAESNIRVNAIGPGPIDNRMIRSIETQLGGGNYEAVQAGIRASIPMKRYGTNEEVAQLASFLASDESSYCTGGIHMIDGGYTAG